MPPTMYFTLDVLSSGSEFTGTTACLFLSLWRRSPYTPQDLNSSTLSSRYSITGCSCDVLSRAAADQRFGLSKTKAVFCTTDNTTELASLPGLLYALQRSGAGSLTIVSSASASRVQEVVELVHGNQRYPTVNVCQCPDDDDDDESPGWWQVFSDDHIIVHVQTLSANTKRALVYLFTFTSMADNKANSILYIPESTPDSIFPIIVQQFSNDATTDTNLPAIFDKETKLLGIVCVQSADTPHAPPKDWFVFRSATHSFEDTRLLVRARSQTRSWCEQVKGTELASVFPTFSSYPSVLGRNTPIAVTGGGVLHKYEHTSPLQTGSSILFEPTCSTRCCSKVEDATPDQNGHSSALMTCSILDRTQHHEQQEQQDDEKEPSNNKLSFESLRRFCKTERTVSTVKDDNEIDLEESDGGDPASQMSQLLPHHRAQLLVLGTGCASPSPVRGASGYALLLPRVLNNEAVEQAIVMEAGEGFCTQWNRHASGRPFRLIQIIWVSHAHWDHYGGLVNLLHRIQQSHREHDLTTMRCSKRQRIEGEDKTATIPFVVAPKKIVRYLTTTFGNEANKLFKAIHPTDSVAIAGMCAKFNHSGSGDGLRSWDTVKVNHGCDAYGCVIGLRKRDYLCGGGEAVFTLAFSGDTRPSLDFVRCSNAYVRKLGSSTQLDFLLHEATFDETEIEMSIKKKHSTIKEALDVAKRVRARRVLLTHFSQRYHQTASSEQGQEPTSFPFEAYSAVDGMAIPLF